ncbi:hypothetical protein LCGC14_2219510 [marine sediment metagenome]|uniref:Uncharacterized protein n=1 Tax=marine sediment metagenome TaxID=412755 RepID=A0A0F9DBD9_9ZZZZ
MKGKTSVVISGLSTLNISLVFCAANNPANPLSSFGNLADIFFIISITLDGGLGLNAIGTGGGGNPTCNGFGIGTSILPGTVSNLIPSKATGRTFPGSKTGLISLTPFSSNFLIASSIAILIADCLPAEFC